MEPRFTRRRILSALVGTGSAALLAACQPKIVEVEKIVKETVVVEEVVKETVIVAGTPQVVEKQVTSIVEKVVTSTPVPLTEQEGEILTVFHATPAAWQTGTWQTKAEMFNREYPKIKLVGVGTEGDSDFVQKVTTMFVGGQPPDLLKISAGRIIALAPKGVFEDLQPRIDSSSLMQRIWPHLPGGVTELSFLGKQVGITREQAIGLEYYNKDLFDLKGVAYPAIDWTWEEMVDVGLKITDPEKNEYLAAPNLRGAGFQDAPRFFWAWGGRLFSENCAHIDFDKEPNIASMEALSDLYTKYKVYPSVGLQLGEIGVSFDSGKLGMTRGGSGAIGQQLGDKATWSFEWSATYAAAGPAGQADYVKSEGWSTCRGAKRPDLAWTFIEWWLSDEAQTAFANAGETVARNDIFQNVALKNIPEHLHPAFNAAFVHGRGLERCPGWSLCQKYWVEEMEPAYLGRVTAREAMMTAYQKAQPELDQLMKELGLA